MDAADKVLETMRDAGEPLNTGKIVELSGMDRKEVEKAMKILKKDNLGMSILFVHRCQV